MDLKTLFKNKKFIIGLLIVTTLVIIKVLAVLIYTKDQPKFIPEEIREDVRGGLKEAAEAIAPVTPGLSKTIVNSAYTSSPQSVAQVNTSDWKTYNNEQYGFELKYPEGWVVQEGNNLTKIYESKYDGFEGEHPSVNIEVFENDGSATLSKWLDANYSKIIGDQIPSEVTGFENQKIEIINGLELLSVDWESMGWIRSTLLKHEGQVILINLNTLGEINTARELLDINEEIIKSIK